MLATALGYASYFFICLFSPVQFLAMLRRKNINFGAWPLASLTLGLALLSLSFFWASVPTYVIVGQTVSLTFTTLLLLRVLLFKPSSVLSDHSTLEKYAKWLLQYTFPLSILYKNQRVKARATGFLEKTPITAECASLNFESGPAPLSRMDFATCTTCTCLVLTDSSLSVEVRVVDVAWLIGRKGHLNGTPLADITRPVRYDHYCAKDKPPYDRVTYYPGTAEGAPTGVEYFARRYESPRDEANAKMAFGAFAPGTWRQVTEDGQPYD